MLLYFDEDFPSRLKVFFSSFLSFAHTSSFLLFSTCLLNSLMKVSKAPGRSQKNPAVVERLDLIFVCLTTTMRTHPHWTQMEPVVANGGAQTGWKQHQRKLRARAQCGLRPVADLGGPESPAPLAP